MSNTDAIVGQLAGDSTDDTVSDLEDLDIPDGLFGDQEIDLSDLGGLSLNELVKNTLRDTISNVSDLLDEELSEQLEDLIETEI